MDSMPVESSPARRRARLLVATGTLLGVDFVPVGVAPGEPRSSEDDRAPAPRAASAAGVGERATAPAPAAASATAPARDPDAAGDRAEALRQLEERYRLEVLPVVATPFHHPVFGEGDPAAALMFVGEGPGAEEDRTGRPFVGPAGQKLDQMIGAMRMCRGEVYIANIVKVRPPGNRTPLPDEVERCSPFLIEQIRIVRPRVIVALGGPAAKFLLRTDEGITRLRGRWGWWQDDGLEVPVMPTFHPAYLLRNYTREVRERVWADLQAVMAALRDGVPT